MLTVIQRVQRAEVRGTGQDGIDPESNVVSIGHGLLLLVGLERGDNAETTAWCARKIAGLRVFHDVDDKMNLSLTDVGGEILAVSQFTLSGSINRGRRPSFDNAMPPEEARVLFGLFVDQLRLQNTEVKTGFFQEQMEVELVNDGPVTFVLKRGGVS